MCLENRFLLIDLRLMGLRRVRYLIGKGLRIPVSAILGFRALLRTVLMTLGVSSARCRMCATQECVTPLCVVSLVTAVNLFDLSTCP